MNVCLYCVVFVGGRKLAIAGLASYVIVKPLQGVKSHPYLFLPHEQYRGRRRPASPELVGVLSEMKSAFSVAAGVAR